MWDSRGIVAVLVALIILAFVVFGLYTTLTRVKSGAAVPPETIGMWKDIMLILIGALATWLGGKTKD